MIQQVLVGSIEFNENHTEITAIEAGKITGHFYIGETTKTFYITIEENVGNAPLETLTLKLDNEIVISTPPTTISTEKPISSSPTPIQNQQIGQTASGRLPQTGTTSTLITIIGIVTLISIILGLKMKKYKDI